MSSIIRQMVKMTTFHLALFFFYLPAWLTGIFFFLPHRESICPSIFLFMDTLCVKSPWRLEVGLALLSHWHLLVLLLDMLLYSGQFRLYMWQIFIAVGLRFENESGRRALRTKPCACTVWNLIHEVCEGKKFKVFLLFFSFEMLNQNQILVWHKIPNKPLIQVISLIADN